MYQYAAYPFTICGQSPDQTLKISLEQSTSYELGNIKKGYQINKVNTQSMHSLFIYVTCNKNIKCK
jgi:hypothetical protein